MVTNSFDNNNAINEVGISVQKKKTTAQKYIFPSMTVSRNE